MRKTFLVAAAAVLFTSGLAQAEVVEAVVARVGDRIITRSQYENRLRMGLQEIENSVPPAEVAERKTKYQTELLNEMLSELLIKDRADRLGIKITQNEINDAVERLKGQYGLKTEEEFVESLRKSGMSRAEMETRLRDTLLTNKVFARELRSRQELSDKELREHYERDKEQYRLPERARLREIVLLIPSDADDAAIGAIATRAETIATTARGTVDFKTLVTEHSESASKDQGGDLGVVSKGELIGALDEAVFNAQTGSVVGPVRSRSGFHIIKVEERLPSEIPGFDAVKDRLRQDASEDTFQRDYRTYIDKLRKEAFVQVNEAQIPSVL
jgi:peptidyl-prolyl cis-trans isomerase SurA